MSFCHLLRRVSRIGELHKNNIVLFLTKRADFNLPKYREQNRRTQMLVNESHTMPYIRQLNNIYCWAHNSICYRINRVLCSAYWLTKHSICLHSALISASSNEVQRHPELLAMVYRCDLTKHTDRISKWKWRLHKPTRIAQLQPVFKLIAISIGDKLERDFVLIVVARACPWHSS